MYEITKLPSSIDIGFTGEHQFHTVEIDMKKWLRQMPNGVPSIIHIRPGETIDDAYIADTTFENGILRWVITQNDLGGIEGVGTMQVWMEEEENNTLQKRGKSAFAATQVYGAINDPNELIPPASTLLMKLLADIITLPSGSDASVELEHTPNNTYILHFKIPGGPKGDKGDKGDPAPSSLIAPAVEEWMDANIHEDPTVVIDKSLTVEDAAADSKAVGDRLDIFAKTVDSTKTGVDLDITDASGNVILRLKDGHIFTKEFDSTEIPDPEDIIDDTAGDGDTNKVWSADKLVSELADTHQDAFVRTTSKDGVDLDIVDGAGNVILRLKSGHIQTKSFDSSVLIDDTAGNGDTDKVWSADKSFNEISPLKRGRTRMKFGAHNGAEYYAPECTIPAYRIAGQQGWEYAWVAGIEFSTDGTMYVLHDDTVDRTTDGTGYLNQMSDAEINALHITQTGSGYDLSDFDPSELIIPTFEQVLQQCVIYGMKMVLRLALFPNSYDTAANKAKWDAIKGMLDDYGVQPEDISCYVSNGNQANVCRTLFGDNVEIATFLGNNGTASEFVEWFSSRSITGRKAAIIAVDKCDLAAAKLLHSNGIRVYVFKYNPSESDALGCAEIGVDVFQNGKVYKIDT